MGVAPVPANRSDLLMLEVYPRGVLSSPCVLPCRASMPLWKITLSYDGTDFHGWQVQPGLLTIQGMLAKALERVTGEPCLPQGSGRTDAGVHALAQVASVTIASPIPGGNLQRALNGLLPASVRVLNVEEREPPFHARHSALRKTYEYRIFPRLALASAASIANPAPSPEPQRICDPTRARYVWDCGLRLSLDALNLAAEAICGTHDFTSFAATGWAPSDAYEPREPRTDHVAMQPTSCRTILHSRWELHEDLLVYRVTGSGFLHHMVRNLVGTFVVAGSGRMPPSAIPEILAARARSAAGPTAPARGLFLTSVDY